MAPDVMEHCHHKRWPPWFVVLSALWLTRLFILGFDTLTPSVEFSDIMITPFSVAMEEIDGLSEGSTAATPGDVLEAAASRRRGKGSKKDGDTPKAAVKKAAAKPALAKITDNKVAGLSSSASASRAKDVWTQNREALMQSIEAYPDLLASLCNIAEQWIQQSVEPTKLHKNVNVVGGQYGIKDTVKCRSMKLAFGPCYEEKSQLRRESMLALLKYATQWDDSTRLPLKEMRIDTVVLITVMRILSMDFYGGIVAPLTSHTREARYLSWIHKSGKF